MKLHFKAKAFIAALSFLLLANNMQAQPLQWAWMRGDTVPPYSATQHSGDTMLMPKYRQAVSWTDEKHSFYIFGGLVNEAFSSQAQYLNDLWKYDPTTNVWTFLKGDTGASRVNGVYGIKGVAAPQNKPGSRFGAATWTDALGNLWLFGGYGMEASSADAVNMNDLWKYNPSTNEWTWMKGDSSNPTSSYGTQGISAASNLPPGRSGSTSWKDASGNFWMFGGGQESTSGATFFYSDLWKYNMTTNQWTWAKGPSIGNVIGVYGIQGIAASVNNPPAMYYATPFADASGNLWMFGGGVVKFGTFNLFNDLWKYSSSTNLWTWVKGSGTSQQHGLYGSMGTANMNNNPGSRCYSAGCTTANGDFWLFGGLGYDKSYNVQQDLNDLWSYNIATNSWTWRKGDSSIFTGGNNGRYGTMGVPDSLNNPAGRRTQCQWLDSASNFWLFGGYGQTFNGQGSRNDLWKINVNLNILPVHLLSFTASLQASETHLKWTIENEQNFDHYEIERSPNGTQFSKIGTVKANSMNGQYSYTDQTRNEKQKTVFYRLKMIDKDGQFTYSPIRQVTINHSTFNIALFPNPAKDILQLQIESDPKSILQLQVLAQDGKVVLTKQVTVQQGSSLQSINISQLAAGHYFLKVISLNPPTAGREAQEPVVVGFEKVR